MLALTQWGGQWDGMLTLDQLPSSYTTLLCDVWGVIHDGRALLPGVSARLARWKQEGRTLILITNAPRPADRVEQRLTELGLDRSMYKDISTSGEAGISALNALGEPVGFMGYDKDRADLEAHGVTITDGPFRHFACTGPADVTVDPATYKPFLLDLSDAGVIFHCLNPDRVVIHKGRREPCAGALADLYEEMGGEVVWYGKPFPAIYRHALSLAGNPDPETVVAIGDGLQTDIAGAAEQGLAAVFVTGGIHAGEEVPEDFGALHGHAGWRPLMCVETL